MNLRRKLAFFMALNRYVEIIVSGVPPLSLSKAKADSLTSVKAYGGTEQRNIPQPYTQVNYVTNTASTAVDTGIMIDFAKNYEFEVECRAVSGSWYILQSRASASGNVTGIHGETSGSTIKLVVGNVTVCTSAITRTVGNKLYVKATLNAGTATLYVKDETANTEDTQTGSYGTTQPNPTAAVYLLGNAGGQYVDVNSDIYMARIKENDTVVMDYVPARQVATAGFYDTASGTFKTALTPANLSADGNTVPTPSDPMDIYCNNGALKILDKSDWTIFTNPTSIAGQGVFISADGKWYNANDRGAGCAIPLTIGKQYTLVIHKKTATLGTILRYGQSPQETPTGAGIQLTDWYRGNIADGQMVSFVAKQPYLVMQLSADAVEAGMVQEAIEVIEAAGNNETIAITTRNIFDNSVITSQTSAGVTLDIDSTTGVITITGATTNAYNYSQFTYNLATPLTAGTYTLSLYNSETMATSLVGFGISGAVGGRACSLATRANNTNTFTIAEGSEADQIMIRVQGNPDDPTHQFKFKIQLEEGSEGTDYIAYNDSTAGVANLFKIDNYKDVQEIITGAITHNCKVAILTGQETGWMRHSTYYWFYNSETGYDWPASRVPVICSILPNLPLNSSQGQAGQFVSVGHNSGTSSRIIVANNFSAETTVADFKQWLADLYAAGTPLIVVYPATTPYTEVSPVPQTIQTVAGDNVLDIVQAGMSGLEVEVKYTKEG